MGSGRSPWFPGREVWAASPVGRGRFRPGGRQADRMRNRVRVGHLRRRQPPLPDVFRQTQPEAPHPFALPVALRAPGGSSPLPPAEGSPAAAPPESRGRRPGRGCRCGTDVRDSAWPRGRAGRAGARTGRNGRPIRHPSASPAPRSPPPGRCGRAGSSAGSRRRARRRHSPRPGRRTADRDERRARRASGADAASHLRAQPSGFG